MVTSSASLVAASAIDSSAVQASSRGQQRADFAESRIRRSVHGNEPIKREERRKFFIGDAFLRKAAQQSRSHQYDTDARIRQTFVDGAEQRSAERNVFYHKCYGSSYFSQSTTQLRPYSYRSRLPGAATERRLLLTSRNRSLALARGPMLPGLFGANLSPALASAIQFAVFVNRHSIVAEPTIEKIEISRLITVGTNLRKNHATE